MAQRWYEGRRLRRFLNLVRQQLTDPAEEIEGRSVADWLTWLEDRVAAEDPLKKGGNNAVREMLMAAAAQQRRRDSANW